MENYTTELKHDQLSEKLKCPNCGYENHLDGFVMKFDDIAVGETTWHVGKCYCPVCDTHVPIF